MNDQDLARLRRLDPQTPRFLFRGFTTHLPRDPRSPHLNGPAGVIPHAWRDFYAGVPTARLRTGAPRPNASAEVRDLALAELRAEAEGHMFGRRDSPFSSWSASFETALYFARGVYDGLGRPWTFFEDHEYLRGAGPDTQFVAVLDTESLGADREVRVFHAPTLGYFELQVEYLVFGPLIVEDGVDVRVVSVQQIRDALGCMKWPACPARNSGLHPVGSQEAAEAVKVARLFAPKPEEPEVGWGHLQQQGGDGQGQDQHQEADDVQTALVATELGRQQYPCPPPRPMRDTEEEFLSKRARWPDGELQNITVLLNGMSPSLLRQPRLPLTDDATSTTGSPQVAMAVELMRHLQQPRDQEGAGGGPVGQQQLSLTGPAPAYAHNCDDPLREVAPVERPDAPEPLTLNEDDLFNALVGPEGGFSRAPSRGPNPPATPVSRTLETTLGEQMESPPPSDDGDSGNGTNAREVYEASIDHLAKTGVGNSAGNGPDPFFQYFNAQLQDDQGPPRKSRFF